MVEQTHDEREYKEIEVGKDIKQLVVDLETGVPSDEIDSLCMECH